MKSQILVFATAVVVGFVAAALLPRWGVQRAEASNCEFTPRPPGAAYAFGIIDRDLDPIPPVMMPSVLEGRLPPQVSQGPFALESPPDTDTAAPAEFVVLERR